MNRMVFKSVRELVRNSIQKSAQKSALFLFAFFLLNTSMVQAGEVSVQGRLKLGGGYQNHPIGLSEERDAGYLSQTLNLAANFDTERNRIKLGYVNSESWFGNDTQLGSRRHGLGVEWFRVIPDGKGGRPGRISAGLQGSDRSYEGFYSLYDYQELYSYLAFKKYMGPQTLLKGYGAIKIRDFGNILGESFREPHGKLEIQRFFQSRTTLGLAVRYGAKFYYDVAASEVWGTLNLPSTSQLSTRLNFSQGITTRAGARGWVEYRVNFDDYPHYIEHLEVDGVYYDLFDSPLLDRYARDGLDAFGALKILGPWQTWLEGGFTYGDYDYGELLFPSDQVNGDAPDEGQQRQDTVKDGYISLKKKLPEALRHPKLVLAGGLLDRESSVARYTFSGIYFSGSLAWTW